MVQSRLGIAAIAAILALTPRGVEERAAALDLPRPHDRPMRKAGPRGWSIDDVRRFVALWIENVATKSIAGAIGRSTGSLYYKRKWLGLESRKRSDLRERSLEACAATPIFWLSTPLVDIVSNVKKKRPKSQIHWTEQLSLRCSHLAFAGLSNKAVAARLSAETGLTLTDQAVADQLSRLMAFRKGSRPALPDIGDGEIEIRAADHIARWELQWRRCVETRKEFWYSRVRGGARHTRREFNFRQKFAPHRQARECAAHFGIA